MKFDKKQVNNWLQIIRFPNLFTIPGDILLGYFVVSAGFAAWSWQVVLLTLISMMLYSAGLIMNDLFDYEEDLRERPSRPLPSGAIKKEDAQKAMAILFAVSIVSSVIISQTALIFTVLLILCIYLYNGPLKKQGIVAGVAMGLCRMFNVFLGASAWEGDWNFSIYLVGLIEAVYIVGVCLIAKDETVKLPSERVRTFTFKLIAAGTLVLLIINKAPLIGIALSGALVYLAWKVTESIKEIPLALLPPKIGQMIRTLIIMSAAYVSIFAPENYKTIVFLLLLYPIAGFVGKKFYAS